MDKSSECFIREGDIFLDTAISSTIFDRYNSPNNGLKPINTEGSYAFRKMKQLRDERIFIEFFRHTSGGIKSLGYMNAINLYNHLIEIIEEYHMDIDNEKLYTTSELHFLESIGAKFKNIRGQKHGQSRVPRDME